MAAVRNLEAGDVLSGPGAPGSFQKSWQQWWRDTGPACACEDNDLLLLSSYPPGIFIVFHFIVATISFTHSFHRPDLAAQTTPRVAQRDPVDTRPSSIPDLIQYWRNIFVSNIQLFPVWGHGPHTDPIKNVVIFIALSCKISRYDQIGVQHMNTSIMYHVETAYARF